MADFIKNFVIHRIALNTYLDAIIDNKPIRIRKLSEREDSCSQCITEYVWYEDLSCADKKLKRGYLSEVFFLKEDWGELIEFKNATFNK